MALTAPHQWLLPPTDPRAGSGTGWCCGTKHGVLALLCRTGAAFLPPHYSFPIYFLGYCCFGEIQCNSEWEGDRQPPTHQLCPALGTVGVGPGPATTLPEATSLQGWQSPAVPPCLSGPHPTPAGAVGGAGGSAAGKQVGELPALLLSSP